MVRSRRHAQCLHRRRFGLPARSLPFTARSGGGPGEHGFECGPRAINDRRGIRRVEPDAHGNAVLGHFLQVVAQREQRTLGSPRSEIPVPAGLVLARQGREIRMGRDEERRAGSEHARAAFEVAGRPAHAGHGFVRPPPHAARGVPERRRLQRDHHPEAKPPLAGALRPPAHTGGIRLSPLEPQAELRPLVRHREIDRFAVQGPRSEPRLRSGGKAGERTGAVGVGAHVDPQP